SIGLGMLPMGSVGMVSDAGVAMLAAFLELARRADARSDLPCGLASIAPHCITVVRQGRAWQACTQDIPTGLGSTLIVDDVLVPMELGHLPYRKGTFEHYVG